MKKTIILAAALLMTTFLSAQKKEPAARQAIENAKRQVAKDSLPPTIPIAVPQKYVIVLDQGQLINLYSFINNADIYSEKGRQLFLDDLKKNVFLLPATDTAKKK